ncbi:multidrug effflux MFS transporter [Rhizobium sp. L1K21]|uniref:multidrug effflux MFS transporter n=1 Tax=Rhizobium sp. L1K21 TaxID=2954933 RepID=UPI00209313FF|nr:multidrug effflux MFS transporter [Rhizobium sp. L1K21]MCO6184720.1 multidrug effflux MFS transporter [Rhizobium sp. L1K21]
MQHIQVSTMSERRTSMIAALMIALGPLSLAMYTPAMPQLAIAFGSPESAIKITLSVYFGGFALAQLATGPIADAFGRRKATLVFLTLYMVGSLLAAFSTSVALLIAGRLVQGIGAAVGQTVARAIIRDQFSGHQAARIMNMTGIILAIAPAMSPTIGGVLLANFGWRSIFFTMLLMSIITLAIVMTTMTETILPDRQRIKPAPLLKAYGTILINPIFMTGTVVLSASVGTLYTLANILPFVLIDEVGLTPTQFGIGMLLQSGMFLLGSLAFRLCMRWANAEQLIKPGLFFIAAGSITTIICGLMLEPSYLSVMGPVALYAFGIAFIIPHLMVAALQPFPHIAGSASSMMGFLQMGTGLLGGFLSGLFIDQHLAMIVIVPAMGAISIATYFLHSSLSKSASQKIEI